MTSWTDDQLQGIGDATEVQFASRRANGSLRPYVTMWITSAGDDLYVRSAGGPDRPWYRHALASGTGRVRVGGIETDVTIAAAASDTQTAIDDAYHAKYDSYGPGIVGSVVGPTAHDVTIRLVPNSTDD